MTVVLAPHFVPKNEWENVLTVIVVQLRECEGFDKISLVVDKLPKLQHYIPCHSTIDAPCFARF